MSEMCKTAKTVTECSDLSHLPTVTCVRCGARLHARWGWDDDRKVFAVVSASDDMGGVPGRLGHEFFCARATADQRRIAGNNGVRG